MNAIFETEFHLPPPWNMQHFLNFHTIQIEATNHCSYGCVVCPREKLSRPRGIMPIDDLQLVLERVGCHSGNVLLHGFGEAFLDASLPKKVALVHKRWPKCWIVLTSTLGSMSSPDMLKSVCEAGLNKLDVSFYGYTRETYKRIHGVDCFETVLKRLKAVAEIRLRTGNPQEVLIKLEDFGELKAERCSQSDIEERNSFKQMVEAWGFSWYEAGLSNYGSGRLFNRPGGQQPCSVVWGYFRGWLEIDWQLSVTPCCHDFNSDVISETFIRTRSRKFLMARSIAASSPIIWQTIWLPMRHVLIAKKTSLEPTGKQIRFSVN